MPQLKLKNQEQQLITQKGERDSGREGRRNPFSRLWPFRSSCSTSNQRRTTGSNSTSTTMNENTHHQMGYSGWPFD
ncbi:hypothetical protein LINPERHAP2_LOCUS16694 [Linum perenne]